jgi:hypothetical protein
VCIALFFARVVAQIEVWLVEPTWLPEADAWYSGLLPYPLLLPAQIALLMFMTVLALRGRISSPRVAVVVRGFALCYFAMMAVRLALTLARHGSLFYLKGAIPVAFHWVLALFALLLARPALVVGSPPASRQVSGSKS